MLAMACESAKTTVRDYWTVVDDSQQSVSIPDLLSIVTTTKLGANGRPSTGRDPISHRIKHKPTPFIVGTTKNDEMRARAMFDALDREALTESKQSVSGWLNQQTENSEANKIPKKL